MKVWVLMQNDFPIAVISDESGAAQTVLRDKQRQYDRTLGYRGPMVYFHLHMFDVDGRVEP